MKTLGLNPYLPFWETVPDGEPHEFGGRIYIYGSHDTLGGSTFCDQDYVCWSAPVEDPGNWRYEGVIYSKMQDPLNGAPTTVHSTAAKKYLLFPCPSVTWSTLIISMLRIWRRDRTGASTCTMLSTLSE